MVQKIQRNIFYESKDTINYYRISYRASEGISKPEDCNADKNIFYCAQNIDVAKNYVESKRKDGIEINSLIEDPLFVDIENQNFRLKSNSPAFKLGFKQIEMSNIGLNEKLFPKELMKFNVDDIDGRRPNFHRNRKGEETYDFW